MIPSSDLKWPSFTIQTIILATNTSFLLKGGEAVNIYLLLSFLIILLLFSLQTTSDRFIYLFPGRKNAKGEIESTPDFDTYLLKYGIMSSIFFLIIGVYSQNKSALNLFGVKFTILVFILVLLLVVGLPALFEHKYNKKISDRLN